MPFASRRHSQMPLGGRIAFHLHESDESLAQTLTSEYWQAFLGENSGLQKGDWIFLTATDAKAIVCVEDITLVVNNRGPYRSITFRAAILDLFSAAPPELTKNDDQSASDARSKPPARTAA